MSGWADPGRNWTIFRRNMLGHPFGIYGWTRRRGMTRGRVIRIGPLGHVQAQITSNARSQGRRAHREIQLSAWGVQGRRGKHVFRVKVMWTTRSKPRPLTS